MINNIINCYCKKHNINIVKLVNNNFKLMIGANLIGRYEENSKYIYFNYPNREYKKSDLALFLINNKEAHV